MTQVYLHAFKRIAMDKHILNILLLFPHFYTPKDASGIRSWQIGRFLAQRGHNVTIIAPGVNLRTGKLYPEIRGKLFVELKVEGLKLIRVRNLTDFRKNAIKRISFELIYALLAFLRSMFIRHLDIIVAAYPPPILPFFGYILSRIRGIPLVFEVRDLMADALSATKYVRSKFIIETAKKLELFIARHCEHIISVSPGIINVMTKKGIKSNKFSLVTNGYEPELFDNIDFSINAREEFGWKNKFVIIYAGGLTQSYDIPTLLRAAKRLRNREEILFVIIGEGDRKSEYITYCRTNKLKNCQFINAQSRDKMPAILSEANVGVHLFPDDPLWSYVLGNKTFDYLASGLPIIYAGRGDTADLIRRAKAGIVVKPEDDEALANAILWLLKNKKQAETMGMKGRIFVKRYYRRDRLLPKFEEVLINVAKKYVSF